MSMETFKSGLCGIGLWLIYEKIGVIELVRYMFIGAN
jgi:hypothetical protein